MPQIHSTSLNFYALFTKVRKKLAETSAGFWTDLEIYNSLNRAQVDVAVKSRCLKKIETITTVTSTQEYDLKDNGFSDIIDISDDGVYFYQNGSAYNELEFKTKKQLNKEFPGWRGVAASIPQYYYYDKISQTIGLYPKPNATNAGAYLFVGGSYKPKVLNAGTAAAGAATTITLATGSSTVPYPSITDDYYNDLYIEIYSGTGAGQVLKITDYVGSTRKCTAAFTTTPDTTSIYGMVPEIPEEAHELMYLYTIADMWDKGGSRSKLSDRAWQKYHATLISFMSDYSEDVDETLQKDTYR